jgi:hypothetical protein
LGSRVQLDKAQPSLAAHVSPNHLTRNINPNLRFQQLKSNVDKLICMKTSDSLNRHARFAEIPDDPAISVVETHIGQRRHCVPVVVPIARERTSLPFARG